MRTSALLDLPGAAWHRLWRIGLRLRYRLLQRHRHERLVLEHAAGIPIVVLPGVLNPKLFWTGELLAQVFQTAPPLPGASVLDMGTGSGIGAVAAARLGARVVAVDISASAVRCARINALLNDVDARIDVRHGDLFAPVAGERFDVVLFNPPYHPGEPRDEMESAFRAADVPVRFARALPAHLAEPDGHALVLLSSLGDAAAFLDAFHAAGLIVESVAEQRHPGELLTVHRVRRPW
ncbi:MAG: methyltransferase [Gemmatimonadota bacterium]